MQSLLRKKLGFVATTTKQIVEGGYGAQRLVSQVTLSQARAKTASRHHARLAKRVTQARPSLQGAKIPICSLETSIAALQGDWSDDLGQTIQITGSKVLKENHGLKGSWTFDQIGGSLFLGGARLVGTVDAPVWQFPTGVERHWARHEVFGSGDDAWSRTFLRFKEERLDIRRRLQNAFATQDFEEVIRLKSAWVADQSSTQDVDGIAEDKRLSLSSGRALVPGVCFRHKKLNYRGIILGCEPWCASPAAWRAKYVPDRPHGEAQPFYYCIVDERDSPGGGAQTSFVAQEDMEACLLTSHVTFPVQSTLADNFFVPCNELGGYVPNDKLTASLQKQRADGRFSVE
jgi:hemimethylated DNA binding protein